MYSSNTSVGGLDLRCKDDSNFIYSVDSRQMVRNLCASQEYFQWDIFLTFTCNMRKHFCTKPICEWLDYNEWTMHFKALHQSASGLFLRVWYKSVLFFVYYLGNSPPIPYENYNSV